jgi:hypothetical protein
MLSKDASLDTFNTTSGRIRWISWMNLGITRMGGVLAYRPEFRGLWVIRVTNLSPSVELMRR